MELNNVPSGLMIDDPIELAVVSAEEDQVMVSDSKSIIKIISLDSQYKVTGQDTVTLNKGRATFTNTRFKGNPGLNGVKFRLESSAIDYTVLKHLDPVKYQDQIISINFRWCKPGEIQLGSICSDCTTGTYSVIWNSTECKTCPSYAACEGEVISLNAGYWRISRNSTAIMECPNEDACLGGYNATSKYPVNCRDGYEGLLCNECTVQGEKKYERISENQ